MANKMTAPKANKMTAVEWYWGKIKSHFEHDGDLFETATFTFAIAKEKEQEQLRDLIRFLRTEDKMGKSVEDLLTQFNRK